MKKETKQPPHYFKKVNKENGFTLLETLIALIVISLIGISVFTLFSQVLIFTGKIKNINRWNKEIIKLERIVRSCVSRIEVPFWIDTIKVRKDNNSVIIPFWKGDKNSFLKIDITDGFLTITSPGSSTAFDNYDRMDYAFLKDTKDRIIGISLRIKKNSKEELTFKCAFGTLGKAVFMENPP